MQSCLSTFDAELVRSAPLPLAKMFAAAQDGNHERHDSNNQTTPTTAPSIRDVQSILGHSSIATTERYLALSNTQRLIELIDSGPMSA